MNRSRTVPAHIYQRRAFVALTISAGVTLAGCAAWLTPEPAKPEGRPRAQQAALRQLGFEQDAGGWELNLSGRVAFAFDDATLSVEGAASLSNVAKVLLSVGIDRITVEGHSDDRGSDAHNQLLSERRSEAVATMLAAKGFALSNIVRRGYGSSRPIAENDTEKGRQLNRRAVLIVSSI
jgi:outer membrane protein OmpA-like peptidoglycan-associated protein